MRFIDDITNFIFVEDIVQKSDIIFIPGGSHPELGEYAANLWKKGLAQYVMPSGGVSLKIGKFDGVKSKQDIYSKEYATDCEFLVDVLTINGVSEDAIIKEDQSGFTKENATFSRNILDQKGIHINSAIICCKSFHARRALMCYQFAFPDIKLYVHPYPYSKNSIMITKENWYKTESGVKRVLGELTRCGNQFNVEFGELIEKL